MIASSPLLAGLLLAAVSFSCGAPGQALDDAEKARKIDEMFAGYVPSFPEVPTVTARQLADQLAAGDVVVVDVREPEEQQVSMIPGAITKEEFEAHAEELRGREVVTYCTIGYRSGLYAQRLREEGWDARNLEGSILAWTLAGESLVGPDGEPTKRVHVYGKTWALAADGYEQVW